MTTAFLVFSLIPVLLAGHIAYERHLDAKSRRVALRRRLRVVIQIDRASRQRASERMAA